MGGTVGLRRQCYSSTSITTVCLRYSYEEHQAIETEDITQGNNMKAYSSCSTTYTRKLSNVPFKPRHFNTQLDSSRLDTSIAADEVDEEVAFLSVTVTVFSSV